MQPLVPFPSVCDRSHASETDLTAWFRYQRVLWLRPVAYLCDRSQMRSVACWFWLFKRVKTETNTSKGTIGRTLRPRPRTLRSVAESSSPEVSPDRYMANLARTKLIRNGRGPSNGSQMISKLKGFDQKNVRNNIMGLDLNDLPLIRALQVRFDQPKVYPPRFLIFSVYFTLDFAHWSYFVLKNSELECFRSRVWEQLWNLGLVPNLNI